MNKLNLFLIINKDDIEFGFSRDVDLDTLISAKWNDMKLIHRGQDRDTMIPSRIEINLLEKFGETP